MRTTLLLCLFCTIVQCNHSKWVSRVGGLVPSYFPGNLGQRIGSTAFLLRTVYEPRPNTRSFLTARHTMNYLKNATDIRGGLRIFAHGDMKRGWPILSDFPFTDRDVSLLTVQIEPMEFAHDDGFILDEEDMITVGATVSVMGYPSEVKQTPLRTFIGTVLLRNELNLTITGPLLVPGFSGGPIVVGPDSFHIIAVIIQVNSTIAPTPHVRGQIVTDTLLHNLLAHSREDL